MNDNPLGLDETKSDVSENEFREGIYKETESPYQGEYHQPVNEDHSQGMHQENPYQQTSPYQEPYQPISQGFGIASMILGIISLVLFCSCVNLILAVISIIFGIIQLSTPESKKGMAIAGLITSGLSILLFLIAMVAFIVSADFQNGFEQGLQDSLNNLPNQNYYESDLPDYEDDDRFNDDYHDYDEDDHFEDDDHDYDDFFDDIEFFDDTF